MNANKRIEVLAAVGALVAAFTVPVAPFFWEVDFVAVGSFGGVALAALLFRTRPDIVAMVGVIGSIAYVSAWTWSRGALPLLGVTWWLILMSIGTIMLFVSDEILTRLGGGSGWCPRFLFRRFT